MTQHAVAPHAAPFEVTNGGMPSCPLGGSADRVRFKFSKDGFTIYENVGTGLLFVHPLPSQQELNLIYSADYFSRGRKYTPPAGDRTSDPQLRNDLRKLGLVRKHSAGKAMLDVGSAMGGFMKVASNEGFNVEGVEVSEFGAQYTRAQLGLKVHCSSLRDASLPAEQFDVVTMWDVIEHLRDPKENIAEVARILRPGGTCFITTGDVSSFYARTLGKRWHLLTPPQHLFYFTPKSLSHVLEQQGLIVKEILWSGKHASLDFVLFKLGETCGAIASPLRRLAQTLGLASRELYVNLADIMTVVAEKRPSHSENHTNVR